MGPWWFAKSNGYVPLCLKCAKSCLRNEKVADMFPRNKKDHEIDRRQNETIVIRKVRTEQAINDIVPVNYDYD